MKTVTVHEAELNLTGLLAEVEKGVDVLIARGDKPVARLVAVAQLKPRVFGALKGSGRVGPEFFEPLPANELDAWGGK